VLKAIAQIELVPLAKTRADAEMITKLKNGAESAVRIIEFGRNEVRADARFQVGCHGGQGLLLKTKHRGEADIGESLALAGRIGAAPLSGFRRPVPGKSPVAPVKSLVIPLPNRSRPDKTGIVVALPPLQQHSIDGGGAPGQQACTTE